MVHVPARVSEEEARRFFMRRYWRNLYGLLLPRPTVMPGGARLPRLEQVWIGYYHIDLRVRLGSTYDVQSVSVEGHSGSFAIFDMHEALVDGAIEGAHFFPAIPEAKAVEIGRYECLRTILRRRSQQKKPTIEETIDVGVFYYPYWVWYFARRSGRLDIRIQNAYTGESGGNRTRAGLLQAFVAQKAAEHP
jgi:hypothetical protein